MDWDNIKLSLKKFLNNSGKNTHLSILIDDIENHYDQNNSLPFKIIDIRENGFIVKVAGLYGFISFNHMPWKYGDIDSWKAIFQSLTGKILFCKIFQFTKEPLSIIINGEIPQFKRHELVEDKKYKGIIVKKTSYGVFVEIGYSFKWNSGSLVGLLHKSNFETTELFDKAETGSVIEVCFWGFNEKEQLLFGINQEFKEWFTGEIEKLVGHILPVKVLKTGIENTSFLVENKYNATLPISKQTYQDNRKNIYKAVNRLKNGDIIHCEIININKSNKTLQLKWGSCSEIDKVGSRSPIQEELDANKNEHKIIQSRVSKEIVEKLKLIGKTV